MEPSNDKQQIVESDNSSSELIIDYIEESNESCNPSNKGLENNLLEAPIFRTENIFYKIQNSLAIDPPQRIGKSFIPSHLGTCSLRNDSQESQEIVKYKQQQNERNKSKYPLINRPYEFEIELD